MAGTSKTRWYVLTGRPCSGISTTLDALRREGYPVVEEAARRIIDDGMAAGRSVEEIRNDDVAFQRAVLERKRSVEETLPRNRIFILDRALPDSVPYHASAGLDPSEVLATCERELYRKVFFLEPLPYEKDYARTESHRTLERLGHELRSVYLDLGYQVVSVPVCPVAERMRRIRGHIERAESPPDARDFPDLRLGLLGRVPDR